jgi:hydroxylamine reductase
LWNGKVQGIGGANPDFGETGVAPFSIELDTAHPYRAALRLIRDRVSRRLDGRHVGTVAHRIVHGGSKYSMPVRLDANVLADLKGYIPLANAVYKERMFTTNSTGYPGCKYIDKDAEGRKDFSEIIEIAKQCQPPVEIEHGEIIGGFAHNQVLQLADKVVDAVKTGAIRRFIVMAGCDGRMKSRDYYTEFAKALPQDTVILTAGCAKYRYNKLGLGDINGIPRVLDAGQCNDSYSLAVIAMKLKEVFRLNDINELPIVYNIAWYEQKAVIVLLALLSLGVLGIQQLMRGLTQYGNVDLAYKIATNETKF